MSSVERDVFLPAARTATPAAVSLACGYADGVHIVIDCTAVTATPSVVPTIECADALSGKWYPLLVGAAVTAIGTTVLRVFPRATPVANLVANAPLTETLRVSMAHGNGNSITYSVTAHLVQ